jgi:hypothetical protein
MSGAGDKGKGTGMGRDEGREAGDEGENGRVRLLPSRNDGEWRLATGEW